jgi:cytidylate kinase
MVAAQVTSAEAVIDSMIIAIDGPAGSGKSTVAKLVARQLDYLYLDTGAMYRAVAYRALSQGRSLADEDSAETIVAHDEIVFGHESGDPLPSRVLIGGEDVTAPIRTSAVDDAVSAVARMPRVREAMVAQQRHIAAERDIVVEGRDIGTVVFPDAELKVYLTATPEERARRRVEQQVAAGHEVGADAVFDALVRRDVADSTRNHSPLTSAADAVELDTTGMTIEQVVERITELAKERAS